MNEELKKLIEDGLATLPTEAKSAIIESSWEEILKNISIAHLLSGEQTNLLFGEVAVIILGYESPETFNQNLVNNLGLDIASAENISNDIYEKIIKVIDEKVEENKKSQNNNIEATNLVTPEAIAPTKPTLTNLPNYSDYEAGKDPYREPVE